jgi:hypothetical protein
MLGVPVSTMGLPREPAKRMTGLLHYRLDRVRRGIKAKKYLSGHSKSNASGEFKEYEIKVQVEVEIEMKIEIQGGWSQKKNDLRRAEINPPTLKRGP